MQPSNHIERQLAPPIEHLMAAYERDEIARL
jgi:hypothetical protein